MNDPSLVSNNRDAYLSVVADSAKVTVLMISRGMLDFLPKKVKKTLMGRIKHFEDVDRPFNRKVVDNKKASLEIWSKYKDKLSSQIIKVRGKQQ